ncbi:MAG: GNAT family N-acetyltransferase [bacterium]
MAIIRKATETDQEAVIKLLKNQTLDLYYNRLQYKDFWVAELDGKIVGCVQLEDFGEFLFLGSLGVHPDYHHQGIAKQLMTTILGQAKKDVYLYTIIPKFFQKFGFQTTKQAEKIPPRSRFECDRCEQKKCVIMTRSIEQGG